MVLGHDLFVLVQLFSVEVCWDIDVCFRNMILNLGFFNVLKTEVISIF